MAANYKFNVNQNYSDIYINKNGSIDIEYNITFTTLKGAKPIDIVDIGLPNKFYNLSTAQAKIDGNNLQSIKTSSYIPVGVEIALGKNEIKPGEKKTLYFIINNSNMVFQDDADEEYAAVEFYPTYYGSSFTSGVTDLKVSFHLPDGVTKDDIITRHNPEVTFSEDESGRLIVTWQNANASPSSQYKFGVSFPKKFVDKVHDPTEYTPSSGYYTYSDQSSGQTCENCFGVCPFIFYFGIFFSGFFGSIFQRFTLKNKYLPPAGKVEGFGANTKLKPAEVALLKQLPLARVSSIIMASLLKKGVITELYPDYKIKTINKDPELIKTLTPFEREYLRITEILSATASKAVSKKGAKAELKEFFTDFIEDTVNKMNKFNRTETIAYFNRLTKDSWNEIDMLVREGDIYSLRKAGQILDSNFEILLLDKGFKKKIKPVLGNKDIPKSKWLLNLRKLKSEMNRISKGIDLTEDYDDEDDEYYVDYFINIFDAYDYFSYCRINDIAYDIVKITNPDIIPKPSSSSSYGGGGCACACACACAGGGR
jgi:hypothetical protein